MSRTFNLRLIIRVVFIAVVLTPWVASAHPAPSSIVNLDIGAGSVTVDTTVPIRQLELALQRSLDQTNDELSPSEQARLKQYVLDHLWLEDASRRRFELTVTSVSAFDESHIRIVTTAPWPARTDRDELTLHDDLILHRVKSHQILTLLRRDFGQGHVDSEATPLGTLRFQQETLVIQRQNAGLWTGFVSLFVLGMHHVAEGTDHLAFVMMLLLSALMTAKAGRWEKPSSISQIVRRVLTLVTAFTVGHSLTLVLGTLGVCLPSTPVEVLIALSIGVTALHAIRPLFPTRETIVAAGFGLVHGLAFSTILRDIGLEGLELAWGVLAFNLGIETIQLGCMALCLPWLVIVSRTPVYGAVQVAGASAGLVLSVAWIGERAFGLPNPVAPIADRLIDHPWPPLLAFAAFAVATHLLFTRLTAEPGPTCSNFQV